MMVLSEEQKAQYERDGYLLLPNFVSQTDCDAMKHRISQLVQEFDGEEFAKFSTIRQTEESNRYFLESGDKIRFFFEEDAFDADGKLKQSLELSLNKIGHNLHELDPVFRRISMSQKFKELSHDLGLVKPIVPQSMAILKQPKIGGLVVPHQDSTFLYTSPGSCIGMWWPLEDASLENGCLWAVPGSHKAGLKRRFKRNADGTGTLFEPAEKVEYSTEGGVPLEIKAGTLVLIHGALVHWSDANKSDKSRYAYSIHVVEGAEGFEYPRDNWLQRDTPFPVFD